MKKTLIPALIGLLACTLSASAISITINEDSAAQLVFTATWDPNAPPLFFFAISNTGGSGSVVRAEQSPNGSVTFSGDYTPVTSPAAPGVSFTLAFPNTVGLTFSSSGIVPGAANPPDFVHALPGNEYGAQFVYGRDVTNGVPDGGSTLMLLAGALGTLGWFKRRFRLRSV